MNPAPLFRGFRAPQGNGSALIDPALADVPDLLASNLALLNDPNIVVLGVSLPVLRRQAQQQLIALALEYTRSYRDVVDPDINGRVILAGHQPELFHPGVWFKNFVLAQIARQSKAIAINLLIDQDICRGPSLRAPDWTDDRQVHAIATPYDAAGPAIPWEERRVIDGSLFASFGARLRSQVLPWSDRPIVNDLWPLIEQASLRTVQLIGQSFSQARHQLEARMQLQTLEIPMSVACETAAFATFLLALATDLPRLREIYNSSVAEYRVAHHLRSRSHPVPQLIETDGWLEAPFWVYDAVNPQRRGLFVRQRGDSLEFTDRDRFNTRWALPMDGVNAGADFCELLKHSQVKVRPRALMNTLYARLVLGDWFIHGIGGGKYDQLTDRILQRYFGMTAPHYSVCSATILLPGTPDIRLAEQHAAIASDRLRRLHFQPETMAEAEIAAHDLVQTKRRLLEEIPPLGAKRGWHDRVCEINRQLERHLDPVHRRLRDQLLRATQEARTAKTLGSREWSFCLFPQDYLQSSFESMLHRTPLRTS